MKVLILEDNGRTRDALNRIVLSCKDDVEVYSFEKREDAYLCAMEHCIDLFLVDIILEPSKKNDNSGIAFADSLRKYADYRLTPIIFITTLMGLERDLLKRVHCYDYIEKPIGDGSIVRKHIGEVLDALEMRDKIPQREYIPLRYDGIGYMVFVDEVIYVQSKMGVLNIHTIDDDIVIPNLSTRTFLKKVQSDVFLVPTYGTAVNKNYISSVDFRNREVFLKKNDDVIPIGARKLKEFREAFERNDMGDLCCNCK